VVSRMAAPGVCQAAPITTSEITTTRSPPKFIHERRKLQRPRPRLPRRMRLIRRPFFAKESMVGTRKFRVQTTKISRSLMASQVVPFPRPSPGATAVPLMSLSCSTCLGNTQRV